MANKSDKLWADAVRKQVHEYYDTGEKDENGKARKIRYLNVLAAKLVTEAAQGDMQAIKEVGDRLDGKPAQAVEMSGEVKTNYVAQMPTHPETPDEWQQKYHPTIQ